MDVGRAHRTSPGGRQQISHCPILRYWIGGRTYSPETVSSLIIKLQPLPSGRVVNAVLDVVETVAVGFPHIDTRTSHGITACASDGPRNMTWLALRSAAHVASECYLRCALCEERPE